MGIYVVRLTTNFKIKYDTSLAYNIYTVLCAVKFRKMNWIKYNEQKPEIGQLVLVYRDIENKQIYSTVWSDEDERFADWNEITHWMPLEYPST